MRTLLCRLVAPAGLLLLAACAGPAIPYDRSLGPPVTSVGVLTTQWPHTPTAVLASSIGQSLGVIGALADVAMEEARNSRLQAIVVAHHFVPSERFDADLRAAITADGYNVVPVDVPRSGFDYLADYHNLKGADAWLDCVGVQWGYVAAGIRDATPYRPDTMVKCRLVRASDQSILMRDVILYNPIGPAGRFVTVAPDPAFAFVTFDKLTADPDRAVAGMDTAFRQTAKSVGTLLK